jgi:hypothetical protein
MPSLGYRINCNWEPKDKQNGCGTDWQQIVSSHKGQRGCVTVF